MQLVFWHNIISPHQAPFIRELAELGYEVDVVSSETMSEDRRRLGWEVPSLGKAKILLGPTGSQVNEIVGDSSPDSVHFVAGARGTWLGRSAALQCRALGRRMGIITEAPDMRGAGGYLRRVKYTSERMAIGKSFDFVLAMGDLGVRWFKCFGYEDNKIFPFAYVTERRPESFSVEPAKSFRILFVGRLISLKGVDVLLRALRNVSQTELVIIGDGPERSYVEELAQKSKVSDRIIWRGRMSPPEAQAQIAAADVLVLPSRKDGWGAVVNEALMAGTPVVCSSACGASELIRYPLLGTVFPSGDVQALAKALLRWRTDGEVSPEHRLRIQRWSERIGASSVAGYLVDVLAHVYSNSPRPEAPWRC